MGLFSPLNQAIVLDRNKEYYAVVTKETNRVLNVSESKFDLSFYNQNKVSLKKSNLITLFVIDLLNHNNMSKTEAIIWAHVFFERVNINVVLDHPPPCRTPRCCPCT